MYFGNLSEELILMVLNPNTGKLSKRNNLLSHGLIGGLILDLVLQGRLTIYKDKLIIIDETLTSDNLLDTIFQRVRIESESLSIYSWLRILRLEFRNIKEMILENLVTNGILRKEIQKTFGMFKSDRFFLTNPNVKDLIINNIQRIVINNEESDHRVLAILSLMYATNCENEVFMEEELETYLHEIRNLVSSDEIGQSITLAINNTAEALMRSLILTTTY
ncbi:MAG: hypothetical protein HeimC2_01380 [Candidatus Heimdallarchaeota archaeon LC_2]|nr:MAG: hypothetical protein HeimC2_01380 [Candidatus Heimdallarchaeota archaeon LC_2]